MLRLGRRMPEQVQKNWKVAVAVKLACVQCLMFFPGYQVRIERKDEQVFRQAVYRKVLGECKKRQSPVIRIGGCSLKKTHLRRT